VSSTWTPRSTPPFFLSPSFTHRPQYLVSPSISFSSHTGRTPQPLLPPPFFHSPLFWSQAVCLPCALCLRALCTGSQPPFAISLSHGLPLHTPGAVHYAHQLLGPPSTFTIQCPTSIFEYVVGTLSYTCSFSFGPFPYLTSYHTLCYLRSSLVIWL